MSLESEFGSQYSQEEIDEFGGRVLKKYGIEACEAAQVIEKTNLSTGSLSSYKPQIRQVISEAGTKDPDIDTALEIISNSNKEGSTKSIMVSAIKKYYQAIEEDEKAEEFHKKAKRSDIDSDAFKGGMEVNEWLTVDEVQRIIDHILPDDGEVENKIESSGKIWFITFEHRAMFETLYFTGCRVGEVAMLDVDDLYFDSNQVKVYRTKKGGDKPVRDMIAVPEKYMKTMEQYINQRDINSGNIFDYTPRTIQNRISDINDLYNFVFGEFNHTEDLTPHKLRHARVTAIANESGLDKAGEFVSHSSVETTKGYRHLAVEDQRSILPEEQDEEESDVNEGLIKMIINQSDLDGKEMVQSLVGEADIQEEKAEEYVEEFNQ